MSLLCLADDFSKLILNLKKIVMRTKIYKDKIDEIAASNAMTILVAGNVPLVGLDFSSISIPYANLRSGIITSCDFSSANMEGVVLMNCKLSDSIFKGTNMKNIEGIDDTLRLGNRHICKFEYSQNGKYLVLSGNSKVFKTSFGHTFCAFLEIYDLEKNHFIEPLIKEYFDEDDEDNNFDNMGEIKALGFSKNSKLLAVSGANINSILICDVKSNFKVIQLLENKHSKKGCDHSLDLKFSPDSSMLAVSNYSSQICIWKIGNEYPQINKIDNIFPERNSFCFSYNSNLIFYCKIKEGNFQIAVYSISKSKDENEIPKLYPPSFRTTLELAITNDGSKLIIISNNSIDIFHVSSDMKNIQLVKCIDETNCSNLAISPDNLLIATAKENFVKIWELSNLNNVFEIKGLFQHKIDAIAFSPDSQILAVSYDFELKFWNRNQKKLKIFKNFDGLNVKNVEFSTNNDYFATISSYPKFSEELQIVVWKFENFNMVKKFSNENGFSTCCFYLRDVNKYSDEILIGGDKNGVIYMWNLQNLSLKNKFKAHDKSIYKIFISYGKSKLLTYDTVVLKAWNLVEGNNFLTLCYEINYSIPDKENLIYSFDDFRFFIWIQKEFNNEIEFYDQENGKCIQKVEIYDEDVDISFIDMIYLKEKNWLYVLGQKIAIIDTINFTVVKEMNSNYIPRKFGFCSQLSIIATFKFGDIVEIVSSDLSTDQKQQNLAYWKPCNFLSNYDIKFTTDKKYLVFYGGPDNSIRFWKKKPDDYFWTIEHEIRSQEGELFCGRMILDGVKNISKLKKNEFLRTGAYEKEFNDQFVPWEKILDDNKGN